MKRREFLATALRLGVVSALVLCPGTLLALDESQVVRGRVLGEDRPLAEVLARNQLGRFRVTQKAQVEDPRDVYRSDGARPEDWIMVGTHDTLPLRQVIDAWQRSGERARRADYLAARLAADPQERCCLRTRLARDPNALATAMFADLFRGPARNVQIFWTDLFGLRESFNRPGVVDGANWSLRVPADFQRAYREARQRGEAPDLAEALAWALHARGLDQDADGRLLAASLKRPEGDA